MQLHPNRHAVPKRHAVSRRHAFSPQRDEEIGIFPTPQTEMQLKLPDTIIWLQQKMHLNYGIVQARVMNSSHDSIIFPIKRTGDKSSCEI